MSPIDVLILSNGPGEITTWIKPVVRELRQQIPAVGDLRISVILSPCPNATGQEATIAQQYPEVDRVQGAEHFWAFLLRGKTAEGWDWRDHGVVLFLGGDQIYPVIIGKRLKYRTVIYAEWFANWLRWIDAFGVMNPALIEKAPASLRHKFTVVGDLMSDGQAILSDADRATQQLGLTPDTELIGLLPGSKKAKLTQGVPLLLAIADHVHAQRPQTRFVIPVAPTIDFATLVRYADPTQNPMVPIFNGPRIALVQPDDPDHLPYLKSDRGTQVFLWRPFPAHSVTRQCCLCVTTVGANTAELGSLGIPMMVLLPTQQLDAMNAWDGLVGLLVNLPWVGRPLNKLVNILLFAYIQRSGKRFAWPNIWAGREVVPEFFGKLNAQDLGDRLLDYLHHPEKLTEIRQALRQVRGEPGAAHKLATLVLAIAQRSL